MVHQALLNDKQQIPCRTIQLASHDNDIGKPNSGNESVYIRNSRHVATDRKIGAKCYDGRM